MKNTHLETQTQITSYQNQKSLMFCQFALQSVCSMFAVNLRRIIIDVYIFNLAVLLYKIYYSDLIHVMHGCASDYRQVNQGHGGNVSVTAISVTEF